MTDPLNHGHGSFERQDLGPKTILYFLLGLLVATGLCMVALRGVFIVLDHYERSHQPELNPLVTNVPEDTRHVAPGYPQSTFPSPKLEEDERGQLNDIRMAEEKTLYSYGWVDEKAGTVHIPIERAMDLLVQRGLPVKAQSAAVEDSAGDSGINHSAAGKPPVEPSKKNASSRSTKKTK